MICPKAQRFPVRSVSDSVFQISGSVRFIRGEVPEWPKGADCKSVVFDFDGSNPSLPTKKALSRIFRGKAFCFVPFGFFVLRRAGFYSPPDQVADSFQFVILCQKRPYRNRFIRRSLIPIAAGLFLLCPEKLVLPSKSEPRTLRSSPIFEKFCPRAKKFNQIRISCSGLWMDL